LVNRCSSRFQSNHHRGVLAPEQDHQQRGEEEPGLTQRLPDQGKLNPAPDQLGQLTAQPAR
jgi:hypothetical protein